MEAKEAKDVKADAAMLATGGRTLQVTSSGALTPVPLRSCAAVPPGLPQGGPYSHFLRRNQSSMPTVKAPMPPSTQK